MTGLAKQSRRLSIQGSSPEQFEFAFAPAPQPPRFRQVEFPWRYRSNRRKPAYEEFKLLRELLGRGNKP